MNLPVYASNESFGSAALLGGAWSLDILEDET
jgi:hypothetical protein